MNIYTDMGETITGELGTIPKTHYLYREVLNEVEIGEAKIIVYEEPKLDVQELREAEYVKRGVTLEVLTFALWERNVENRPEESDRLQKIREEVKALFPKE